MVRDAGGYDATTEKQLWKDLYAAMGYLPVGISAGLTLKSAYERYVCLRIYLSIVPTYLFIYLAI